LAVFSPRAPRPHRAEIELAPEPLRDLAPDSIPAEFPESSLVEPQPVIFDSADGLKIHGQLFQPANLDKTKRHPAILFFHGGSRKNRCLGWGLHIFTHN